jgi:hypothetical protein
LQLTDPKTVGRILASSEFGNKDWPEEAKQRIVPKCDGIIEEMYDPLTTICQVLFIESFEKKIDSSELAQGFLEGSFKNAVINPAFSQNLLYHLFHSLDPEKSEFVQKLISLANEKIHPFAMSGLDPYLAVCGSVELDPFFRGTNAPKGGNNIATLLKGANIKPEDKTMFAALETGTGERYLKILYEAGGNLGARDPESGETLLERAKKLKQSAVERGQNRTDELALTSLLGSSEENYDAAIKFISSPKSWLDRVGKNGETLLDVIASGYAKSR